MNGTPPKLTFEITKSTEITKLISDGIRAAEALEDSILRQKQHQQQQASGLVNQGLANNFIVNNNNNNNNLNIKSANDIPLPGISASSTSASSSTSLNYDASKILPQTSSPYPLVPPQEPQVSTKAPEMLQGETKLQFLNSLQTTSSQFHSHSLPLPPPSNNRQTPVLLATHSHSLSPYNNHYHMAHPHHIINNVTNNLPLQNSQKPISLSEFLRPPFNAPLFHPVKLPGRRPYPGPIKKLPASKPILPQQLPRHPLPTISGPVPQPSVIVNHYRKPVPSLLRPFIKDKPFPLQPLAASVLLLGQPTELTNIRKTDSIVHMLKKPIIPVPYADIIPQATLTKPLQNKNAIEKLKTKQSLTVKNLIENISLDIPTTTTKSANPLNPIGVFKEPFDIQEIKEEPTPAEIATMKPAVNEGFKPDTVVVESGFKPILRQDGPIPPPEVVEQFASRREDPGLEIDEAMETDTLFLTSQQQTKNQNFEPMFIPSPPDSTNATIIIRKSSGVQSSYKTNKPPLATGQSSNNIKDFKYNKPISSMLKSTLNLPEAAKLRNTSLEDTSNESDHQNSTENSTTVKQLPSKLTIYKESKESEEIFSSDEYLEMENYQSDEIIKPTYKTVQNPDGETKFKSSSKMEEVVHKLNINNNNSLNNKDETDFVEDLEFDEDNIRDNEKTLNDMERDNEENGIYLFDLEQPEAQAAERVDTYYLPPDNRKIPHANIPSGSVITYDGKTVMDSSLVLPPKLDAENDDSSLPRLFNGNARQGLSKLEQLIRSTPQVVPFQGEIPPLTPDISPTTTQRSINNKYSLHLTPPSLSSSFSSVRPSSTKLQIIRNIRK